MTERIEKLARRCADKGLDYRAAKALFDALYIAEISMITNNNRMRAAKLAGLDRSNFYRLQRGIDETPTFKTVRKSA